MSHTFNYDKQFIISRNISHDVAETFVRLIPKTAKDNLLLFKLSVIILSHIYVFVFHSSIKIY